MIRSRRLNLRRGMADMTKGKGRGQDDDYTITIDLPAMTYFAGCFFSVNI